jgi:LmbE family N-acetylglucosaminyl deacetylase
VTTAVIIIVLATVVVAVAVFGPRAAHMPVRLADPVAAKAAGDELLASVDATVLVFTAHPDDAEWWSGGTLAMLAKRNRVVLVLGTSGDAGNGGLQSNMGAIREALQLKGAKVLGYADVIFLRHKDGHLAEAADYPSEVEDLVRRYRPSAIVSFDVEEEGPVYHHVDHEAAGRAALAAAEAVGDTTLYLIHTSAPDVLVDFEPVRARKSEALQILWSYHDTGIAGWFSRIVRAVGIERRVEEYSGRGPVPRAGVTYGELMRKRTVR